MWLHSRVTRVLVLGLMHMYMCVIVWVGGYGRRMRMCLCSPPSDVGK
jgi:hypothetical protein